MQLTPETQLSAQDLRDLTPLTWTLDGMLLPTDTPAGRLAPLTEADALVVRESLAQAVEAGTHVVTVRERREDSISFFVDGPGAPKGFFSISLP